MFSALVALRLLLDPTIADFTIATNDEAYGKFDDVVISIVHEGGKEETFAVQLKHKESANRTLQAAALEATSGDFSLEMYYQSYRYGINVDLRNNCNFVLYTNIPFGNSQRLTKFEASEESKTWCAPFLLTRESSGSVYSFQYKVHSGDKELLNFMKHFSLCCGQANLKQLQTSAKDTFLLKLQCGEDCWLKYLDFFRSWFNGDYSHPKLTKSEVLFQILYFALRNYIVKFPLKHGANMQLIMELSSSCDVMVVSNCKNYLPKLLSSTAVACVDEDFLMHAKNSKILKKTTKNEEVSTENIFQLSWHLGKEIPMVAVDTTSRPTTFAILQCLLDRPRNAQKLVLVGDVVEITLQHLTIIRSLTDIKNLNRTAYEKICGYSTSLQGRVRITIGELSKISKDAGDHLTLQDILQLRAGDAKIGECCTKLPEHYMDRTLTFKTVNVDVINAEFIRNNLIILTRLPQSRETKGTFVKIKEYKRGTVNDDIVVVEEDVNEAVRFFQDVCKSDIKKGVYLFRDIDNDRLELIKCKGNIGGIREFISDESVAVAEEVVFERIKETPILAVCAKSGTGKTVFSKYISAKCPSTLWVIPIILREHAKFFRERNHTAEDVLVYFTQTSCNESDKLSKQIMNNLISEKKIMFLFDGCDELPSNCIKSALACMHAISTIGYRQVITCRSSLEHLLEKRLGVHAASIAEIDELAQESFIERRLKGHRTEDEVEEVLKSIRNNRRIVKNNDTLGVPLQLYMLTEILLNDASGDVKDIYILTNMYEHFFLGKYDHFVAKTEVDAEEMRPIISGDRIYRFEMYQIAALETCLDQYDLERLEITFRSSFWNNFKQKCTKFLSEIKTNGDHLGVIDRIADGIAVYAHQSFAEYFVALFFSENFKDCPVLGEFLFDQKYNNIRLMFDMLLAKDSPAHLAVLYGDFDKFTSLADLEIYAEDMGGRNPLHLFCSWGRHFPLLPVNVSDNEAVCDASELYPADLVKNETSGYSFAYLLARFDPTEKDSLYRLNAISYADKALSLSALNQIARFHSIALENLSNFKDTYSVLVYSILNDFWDLFSAIELSELPYVKIKFNSFISYSILGLAAEFATSRYVERLLNYPVYSQAAGDQAAGADKYLNQESPLKLAISRGDSYVVKLVLEHSALNNEQINNLLNYVANEWCNRAIIGLLLTKGADVNHPDQKGNTPLLLAARRGDADVIKYLLENGADINAMNQAGQNAFILASKSGNVDVAKFFLWRGGFHVENSDFKGNNPLLIAAKHLCTKMVKYLIYEKECNVNVTNKNGENALHLLSLGKIESYEGKITKLIDLFLNEGVDLEAKDNDGNTPLLAAVNKGLLLNSLPIVKHLLHSGANINVTNVLNESMIHLALKIRTAEVVPLLLIKGSFDLEQADKEGNTPLLIAAKNGNFKMLKYFFQERNCNINAANENGETALHLAEHYNTKKIVKFLLDNNMDCNKRDKFGQTPLHHKHCTYYTWCCVEVIDLLIEKGAEVDARNLAGDTPLMLFCRRGRFPNVEQLILKGADITAVNNKKQTALIAACISGNVDLVRYLIRAHEFDVEQIYEDAETPLSIAVLYEYLKLLEYLVEYVYHNVKNDAKFIKYISQLMTTTTPGTDMHEYLKAHLENHNSAFLNSETRKASDTYVFTDTVSTLSRRNGRLTTVDCCCIVT